MLRALRPLAAAPLAAWLAPGGLAKFVLGFRVQCSGEGERFGVQGVELRVAFGE